jgi:hypothetical protein
MVPIVIFFVRLGLKAVPDEKPGLLALLPVYVAGGTFFMVLHLNGSAMTAWALDKTDRQVSFLPAAFQRDALPSYYHNAAPGTPRPNQASLLPVASSETAAMFGQNRMSVAALQETTAVLPASVSVRDIPAAPSERTSEQAHWSTRGVDIYETVTVVSPVMALHRSRCSSSSKPCSKRCTRAVLRNSHRASSCRLRTPSSSSP